MIMPSMPTSPLGAINGCVPYHIMLMEKFPLRSTPSWYLSTSFCSSSSSAPMLGFRSKRTPHNTIANKLFESIFVGRYCLCCGRNPIYRYHACAFLSNAYIIAIQIFYYIFKILITCHKSLFNEITSIYVFFLFKQILINYYNFIVTF